MLDYLTREEEPRWTRWLLLLFVPLGALYLVGARGNSDTHNNTVEAMYANDQKVYIRLAQDLKQSGWTKITPRHRTPGYPYVLSPFFTDDLATDIGGKDPVSLEWFARARTLSIWLSVVCLAALYFFSRRVFPVFESALFVAAAACLLYVFRAGYTQPELLYWTGNLVVFVLLMRMLVRPGWGLAAACGALAALTHLVKAGTQPLMLLFVASFGLKLVWDWLRERTAMEVLGKRLLQGALVPVCFLICLAPYLINSHRMYGEAFYSIYSKYLMWTIPEVEVNGKLYVDKLKTWAVQNAGAGYRQITVDEYRAKLENLKRKSGEPYVEPDGLPTMGRYFKKQTLPEILARPQQGIRSTWKRMEKYYPSSWRFLKIVMWVALGFAVAGWRWTLPMLRRHGYVALYAVGFFAGYMFLYGWYDALRIGPRLMLGLYTPALFTALMLIHFSGREVTLGSVARDLGSLASRFRPGGDRAPEAGDTSPRGLGSVRATRLANLVLAVLLTAAAISIFADGNSDIPEERGELYRYFSGK